jgi:hypothetical protein
MARGRRLLAAQRAGDPPVARACPFRGARIGPPDTAHTPTGSVVGVGVAARAAGGGSPRPAAELLAAAKEHGWSERTLRNARHLAEAKKYRVGFGGGGQWQWTLSNHDAETAPGTPSSNTAISATSAVSAISSTSVLPLSSGHHSDAAESIEMDTPSSSAKDQEDAASGEE